MKNKIVILSAFLSPMRSGAEACAEEVPLALHHLPAEASAKEGEYDFTIVTARMRKDLPRYDRLQNKIPIVRVGLGLGLDKWLFPFLAPLAARKLKPDVIHAVLETFAGLALAFCRSMMPGIPRLLTLQTTNRRFLKGAIIRSAHRITAISHHLKDIAQPYAKNEIEVIPNGIDLAAIRAACAKHKKIPGRILFVGRLETMKGVDVLLKAFARVQLSIVHCQLFIVGGGSQRQSLEKLAQQLSIKDRVTFLGYLPTEKVHEEYAQAEIFCGLSRSEALGNVFIEAQAAGCAVIGTNVGGIPDILDPPSSPHHKGGVLVEPDNVEEATEAIERLIKSPEHRHDLITVAQKHAAHFDWSVIAAQYKSIYDHLLSKP